MKYNKGLEQIRGIACLLVWMQHFGRQVFMVDRWAYPLRVLAYAFSGEFAVVVFFVLSGFLFRMIYTPQKTPINWCSFMRDRCFRILPVYALMCILLTSTNWRLTSSPQLLDLLTFIPLAKIALNDPTHIAVFNTWSIGVEFSFYLMCPLLLNIFSPKQSWKLLGIIMITNVLLMLVIQHQPGIEGLHIYQYTLLGHISQFLIGILGANLYLAFEPKHRRLLALMIGTLALLALITTSNLSVSYTTEGIIRSLGWGVIAMAFIYTAFMTNGIGAFVGLLIEKMGRISYSFYLLHVPISWSLIQYLQPYNSLVTGGIALGSSILISVISYLCIEKPFIEYGRSFHTPNLHNI